MKNTKKRVVKAWAILHKSREFIADDDNGHFYVYETEPKWYTGDRVVPCEITYTL